LFEGLFCGRWKKGLRTMELNRAFVMGHPIAHSRSPMLHGYWLKQQGIVGSYERLDIAPSDLAAFFSGYRKDGWIGGNVTIPHKIAVIDHLDRIDADAAAMGAVNTIFYDGEALVGGNTDSMGFIGNLDELAPGWDRDAKRAVIIGAGGAARAAVYGFIKRGVEVALCNRTVEDAERLATHFGAGVKAFGLDFLNELIPTADVLVNATSLGMVGQPALETDLSRLRPHAIVYDVVYVPLETAFIKAARARGNRTVDGLGMLLHQGVEGFHRWFGIRPEVTKELRELIASDIRAKTPGA
jgi:shikimate dehydrogenase